MSVRDVAAAVSATALDARFVRREEIADQWLVFAGETIMAVADEPTASDGSESGGASHPGGADRSAVGAMPLLLLP